MYIRFLRTTFPSPGKKASKYYENPQGKKLPRVRGELDSNLFNSWIIYLATAEEDREKIWGNSAIMKKFNLLKPVESINYLLIAGEKSQLIDLIFDISKLSDDEDEEEAEAEDYAKLIRISSVAQWLHFAYQNHNKEPGVLLGLRTVSDPVTPGERAFMMASDLIAIEDGFVPVKVSNFAGKEEE